MILTLYDQYGSVKTILSPNDTSTQDKEIQGDNVLSLSFTLYEYVSIDVNDYVDFEGERYWAVEKYLPKEKSTVEWEYNVKLYGIESLIKRFLVLKTVDDANEAVFTLTARPIEHMRLIVQNINDGMDHTTNFKVGTVEGTDNVVIDYTGKYCDEGLKELAEKVGVEWWMEGETVNLCRCEHGEEVTLGYGNGLTSLDRDVADNAKFYTRLFPIGSSRNIDPERYGASRLQLPGGAKYVDVNADRYGIIHHYEQEAFSGIYPRRVGVVSSVRSKNVTDTDGNPYTIYYFKDNDIPFDPNDYEIGGLVKHVSFQEGSELAGLGTDNDHYFEVNYNSSAREFEIITIWPYDDDTQLPGGTLVPKVGDRYILWNIRMPDEYYGLAEREFQNAVNEYNTKHALDVSLYKAPTDHVWIEDEGVDLYIGRRVRLESHEYFPDTGYRASRITRISRQVTLPSQMDLEISDALSTGTLSKIDDAITDTKNYTKEIIGSMNVPDIIRSGDKTTPTDNTIYSSRRAQLEFLSKCQDDTAHGMITFEQGLKLLNHLLTTLITSGDAFTSASGSDAAVVSEAKLLSTFLKKSGDTATGLMTFLRGIATDTVTGGDFRSGTFDGRGFGLWMDRDGKSHMEVDVLSARLRAMFTALEIQEISYSGGNLLLSAAGNRIVRVVPLDSYGLLLTGYTLYMDGDRERFVADRAAWLAEMTAMSGNVTGWRCYFLSDDGEKATVNLWRAGDMARCATFNLQQAHNVTNRSYWRLVTAAGLSELEDGQTYGWVDLSNVPRVTVDGKACTGYASGVAYQDIPMVDDKIVQMGSQTDASRQNLILLDVVGTNAPALKGYEGIDGYTAVNDAHLVFLWSPKACHVRSDKFRLLTSGNSGISENPIVNDRGAWVSGVNYAYYDRVSYNGNLWLCTNQSGTSGMPSVSSDWLLQVSKGEDGKAFNIKDKVNSVSDLPATGEEGVAYMVGDHLYVWSTIYNTYWNGWGQQDAPFSGFVSSTPITLTAGQKYKVVIDAVTTQSEYVDVVPVRSALGNVLYLAKGAEMTSGGAQATETEAFLLYPSGNEVNVYYQNTGLGNYASITIDVYEQSVGWRDMGTLRGVDGSDAYNIQLSTDNVIYDTDVNGEAILPDNPSSTPIANVTLYKGGDVVSNPTVTVTSAVGCTASASGANIYITAVSASQGQVTLSVSKGTEFSGSKVLRFACITYETMKSFAQEIVGDSMTNYATSARVATLEGDIYTPDSGLKDKVNEGVFGQSSTSVTSRLSTSEGAISDLQQTAEGIETSVKGGLVNLFSDGERERASEQGTVSVSVTDIIRSTIGYAYATYVADVKMSGESATAGNVSLSLYSGSSIYSKSFDIPRDGAWHRVSITVAIPTTTPLSERTFELVFTENGSAGYSVRHIMVQLGVYASQWSPSVADNETKFLQKPDSIGLVAYKQGGEVASIGAFSDGKVKLTGEEIILEGNVTANGNVHINQDGTLYAKNGVFDGYLRSSVELSSDTSYAIRETLNFMATNDCNVYLPCDPDYIGSRVLIVGGYKGNGEAAIVRVYPGMAYGKRCYEIFPYGDYAGEDPMSWLDDDAYTKGVKMPWANISQNYDPWQCRVIIGVNDMPSDGSGIKFSNGAIELLGVPCYKGSSGEHYPIYKLKEDASGTIVGKKLNPNGTIDTLVDTTYSRDGEVENWTQWVIINRSVETLVVTK